MKETITVDLKLSSLNWDLLLYLRAIMDYPEESKVLRLFKKICESRLERFKRFENYLQPILL